MLLTALWHKIANLDKPFTTTITDFVSEFPFKVMTVMSPGGNITALKMVAASLAALARGLNIYGFISSPRLVLPLSSATVSFPCKRGLFQSHVISQKENSVRIQCISVCMTPDTKLLGHHKMYPALRPNSDSLQQSAAI